MTTERKNNLFYLCRVNVAILEIEEDMHEREKRDNPVTEVKPLMAIRASRESPETLGQLETKDNPESLDKKDCLALGQIL